MYRVVSLARVNPMTVRYVCIPNDAENRDMIAQIPYPCYELARGYPNVFEGKPTVDISSIPIISNAWGTAKAISSRTADNLLRQYFPMMYGKPIIGSIKYDSISGWLTMEGRPICMWRPLDKSAPIEQCVRVENGVFCYTFEKEVYILTDEGVRHKPAKLGEVLTINLSTLESLRYIHTIKGNQYYEAMQCFDGVLWKWKTVHMSEPKVVLGMKGR